MPIYRFGPHLLDPARRELSRDGVPLKLPPRAFDLIVYLLERRERAVGRDELIAGVWGRTEVSDNVLDQIVLRARRALGDLSEPRQYIATRPRFGFAWLAPVELLDSVAAHEDRALDPEAGNPIEAAPIPQAPLPAKGGAHAVWLLIAAVLILLPALLWLRTPATPDEITHAAPPSVATTMVMPFEVGIDADASWARLGLMELVAVRLRESGIDTLPSDNVIALTRGLDPAHPGDAELAALARTAGATQRVQGRVGVDAGLWRVDLQLLREDGSLLEARGEAQQPLDAAREASDQLVLAVGGTPAGLATGGDPALALRLQQIDAAVLGDALDVAQSLLESLDEAQQDEPAVRLRAASLRFRRGELDAASAQFQSLLEDVSASDEPRMRGHVLNALGNIALRLGAPDETEQRSEEAIALLAPLPASPELGRAYTGRAIARSTQGNYPQALQDFAQARVVLDSLGDRLGAARVDLNVGILDARRDRFAEAEPVLAAAADRLTAFNDLTNELFARVSLAQVRLGLLEPATALTGDARLAELIRREPNAERRRYAGIARARVLAANGRLHEAAVQLDEVRGKASEDGDIILLGVAQALAGQWALPNDPSGAVRESQSALNAPWADEDPRLFALTWLTLVRGRLTLSEIEAAEAALAGFESWAASRSERSVDAALWLARAELAAARTDSARAENAFVEALAAADRSRVPAELLEVSSSYSRWLLQQDRNAEAIAIGGRSAVHAERDYGAAIAMARLHRALGHATALQTALAQAQRLAGERSLPPDLVDTDD